MSNFVPISIDRDIEDRDGKFSGTLTSKTIGQLSKECAEAIESIDYICAIKIRAREGITNYQWFKTRIVLSVPSATLTPNSNQELVIEMDINIKDFDTVPEGFVANEIKKQVMSKSTSYLYALETCLEQWKAQLA